MIAQEFILIPKDSYIKKQPRALDVLDEPAAVEKANVWLSSNVNLKEKKKQETVLKNETKPEDIKSRVLKFLSMLKAGKFKVYIGQNEQQQQNFHWWWW